MTYLVQVPIAGATAEGADFFVMEVDGQVDRGVVRSARPDQVVATAAESFEAGLVVARAASEANFTVRPQWKRA
jgi:hypothetical protein